MIKSIAPSFLLVCFFASNVFSQPRLASLFTDNMVLQQNSEAAVWGWANPNNKVTITTSWSGKRYEVRSNDNGVFIAHVSTPPAGGPFSLSVTDGKTITLKNIMIGEVWLCSGQSNMEMPVKGFKGQPVIGSNEIILRSSNPKIRLFTVPRSSQLLPQDTSKQALWKEAGPETVSNFSATGYFFGKTLAEILNVPIGLIHVSWGGSNIESWMDAKTLGAFPEIKIPSAKDSTKAPNRTPTALYNGMIHPLVGYTIKGFIWYQGESNYERPDQYELLFPAMVQQWRSLWKAGNAPFYFVQIAPYNYAQLPPYNVGGKYNSAYLRDAQRKSVKKIPNSGMAVVMDIGEEKSIHPAAKKQGGERLALLALAKTYELKGFGYESPSFDTLVISNGIAEVKFRHAENWLTAYGKELNLFEIAGDDKVFYPAKAVIYRSSVMVSSPQVKDPKAVRYAFKDFIVGELYSTEGLPVSSFRTDNW
jgi:sialate O-acetylesterase